MMAEYVVREVVTLVWFVEADNEADALWRASERGARGFDEIDCGANAVSSEPVATRED